MFLQALARSVAICWLWAWLPNSRVDSKDESGSVVRVQCVMKGLNMNFKHVQIIILLPFTVSRIWLSACFASDRNLIHLSHQKLCMYRNIYLYLYLYLYINLSLYLSLYIYFYIYIYIYIYLYRYLYLHLYLYILTANGI